MAIRLNEHQLRGIINEVMQEEKVLSRRRQATHLNESFRFFATGGAMGGGGGFGRRKGFSGWYSNRDPVRNLDDLPTPSKLISVNPADDIKIQFLNAMLAWNYTERGISSYFPFRPNSIEVTNVSATQAGIDLAKAQLNDTVSNPKQLAIEGFINNVYGDLQVAQLTFQMKEAVPGTFRGVGFAELQLVPNGFVDAISIKFDTTAGA